uniref:Exocyst subunit Exo70 family protein n=2 Tax=Triticum urartu TaxID=4572 RepID=A0A8R7PLM1_TRIUA
MADQLAAVPEESATGFTADYPPRNIYLNRIRTVPVSGAPIRWTVFPRSQSGRHNGSSCSSDSGASNSNPSNKSSSGAAPAFAFAAEMEDHALMRIAREMVRDGYTQHMVQAFHDASPAPGNHALNNRFLDLDADWVLQIHDEHGLRRLLQEKPASTPQDFVERWIRAFTINVVSITELVFAFHETPAVARFGKASITQMLVVVDVIITILKAEKLQAVLDMFTCVCGASYMFTPVVISPEAQSTFNEISPSLERVAKSLSDVISSTMEEVRTLVEEDDSWAIEIPRGGGEIHNNTRFIMDCIASMTKAQISMQNSAPNHDARNLRDLKDDTIDYLEDMLLNKSELCSDPSLRYLFLLNNFYFVAQASEPSASLPPDLWFKPTPECEKYMDSYLGVSWGHVLSCIPKSNFHGPLHAVHRWINTSSLAKFHTAFNKTYQAQKFWKVPDPRLRSLLRETITNRVISAYNDYLKEHPELEKHVSGGSSSPTVLGEKLGQLFEG